MISSVNPDAGQAGEGYRSTISWFEYVALIIPTFVAVLAAVTRVIAALVDRSVPIGAGVALLGMTVAIVRDPLRPSLPTPAINRLEPHLGAAALAAVQVLVAWQWLRRVGFSLVPRSGSSDFGSHGGLVTWIAEQRGLPSPERWNSSLSNYPVGGHLPAGLLSWVTGIAPLESLWIVAMMAIMGLWPLLSLIARLSGRSRSWWSGALILVFVFAAYRYTVGIITFDFFFAQLMGQWLAVAGVARIVAVIAGPAQSDAARPGWLIWAAWCAAGSVLAYPQGSVVVLGSLAASLCFGPMSRRLRVGLLAAGAMVGIAAVAALSRTVYWNLDLLAGSPGQLVQVNLADVGGPVSLVFAAMGLVALAAAVRTRRCAVPVIGALAGPLLVVVAMLSLRAGFPISVNVSDYRVVKNVYSLIPMAVVCAAVGTESLVNWLLTGLPSLRRRVDGSWGWLPTAAVGCVAVFTLYAVRSPTAAVRQIYDRDLYRLARALPPEQRLKVGLVAPWVEVNVMRWVGIGPPVRADQPTEFPRTERWRAWPDPAVDTDELLVAGPYAARYRARKGVTVVKEVGSAVLLRRK